MSYQTTVADIIAGSQKEINYQTKDLLKNSSSVSTSSFEDLVSFYKQSNNNEEVSRLDEKEADVETKDIQKSNNEETTSDKINQDENTQKVNKDQEESKDVKEEEADSSKEDESVDNNNTSQQISENKDDKSVKGELDTDNTDKKIVNLSDNKNSNVQITKEDKKDSLNVNKKINNKKQNNKKLTDKDFSRIHEISENVHQTDNGEQQKLKADKVNVKEIKENEAETKLNDLNPDEINTVLNQVNQNSTESNNFGNKNNNSDKFEISEKENSEEKFFLDKENKIEVHDLRSDESKIIDLQNDNKSKLKVSEPKLVNENTATMTMELSQNANADILSTNNQTAAANGSNFQAMLNNQIQQNAPEFVKAGNLVLKDNNQGTINLVLHPDDLGNVKLHLSLDGKNISGHITVATKEALQVFKDNAETLREAFIKNGFDSASFEVSYGNNGSFGQQAGFEQQQDGSEIVAKRVYNNGVLASNDDFGVNTEKNNSNQDYSINIVA